MIRVAKVISFLGHPLLTATAFLLFIAHRSSAVSLRESGFVIAAIVIPLALWNLRQTRIGAYSNFDVSIRTERHSMYLVSLALTALAVLVLYLSKMAFPLRAGITCMLALFATAAAANHRIKVSLHAAISCYLAVVMMAIDPRAGVAWFGCALAIALSRLVLRRHTLPELAWGGALGVAGGVVLVVWLGS